jgi:hypothetical protein
LEDSEPKVEKKTEGRAVRYRWRGPEMQEVVDISD